jgi:hypothetical protein
MKLVSSADTGTVQPNHAYLKREASQKIIFNTCFYGVFV